MFQNTRITRILFYSNLVVFLFTFFIPNLIRYLAVYPLESVNYQHYQMITSMFTHAGIAHIFFNMLALLSFGPSCEIKLGERNFILFYIVSGIVGALLQLSFTSNPLIGASAAIFGLLAFSTMINPNQKVQIIFFPFVSFKAKWLVSLLILFEIYAAFSNSNDGVGHFAHLGGALTGLVTFIITKFKK